MHECETSSIDANANADKKVGMAMSANVSHNYAPTYYYTSVLTTKTVLAGAATLVTNAITGR